MIGIIFLLLLAFNAIYNWKLFRKMGISGWKSLIPIYNVIVEMKALKIPTWNFILFFIPIAQVYIIFIMAMELSTKFKKDIGFGIGMALLPIVFRPILAFSNARFEDANTEDNKLGVLDI